MKIGVFFTAADEVIAYFWSPDGNKILYFSPVAETNGVLLLQVQVLDIASGEIRLLSTIRPAAEFLRQIVPYFDQYQRSATIWSPDSRFVVLNAATRDGHPGIYSVPISSGEEARFIANGQLPFWSPQ